jgi:hypothetical protein
MVFFMSAKTAQGLVAHARAQLGLPYFYGTYGQRPTAELIDYKRRQYPGQWSQERVAYAKQHYLNAPRVYDCAGIVKSYWMQDSPTTPAKYVEKYDKSAGGLKVCCSTRGPISSIPEVPGVLVFIGTRHVGVYAGGGRVIEAKGFNYGVVESNLKRGSWDAWGKLGWLDYGDAKLEMPDACVLDVGDRVRFRAGTEKYTSNSVVLPKWVKGGTFTVKQVTFRGRPRMDGAQRCVLLAELNTWGAVDFLERV